MSGNSRARWGWYRLAEPFARDLVERSDVGSGDLVLDLGAGDGALTGHLARTGARVIAFELHPERADTLRQRFDSCSTVKVVRADVSDLRLPSRPFRVVANPPFAVASAALARLTSRASRLEQADLILPVDVAARWAERLAPTGWSLTVASRLPRSAFTPRPRVDCCVARIGPRSSSVSRPRPESRPQP